MKLMRSPPSKRNDRPIDRGRNSAIQAQIEGDVGAILTMFPLKDERLFFICERGVTSGQLADEIDPGRTNPSLPQIVQTPELTYGASSPFIQRTLCVAAELFDQTYFPQQVSRDDGLVLALEAARALSEVEDTIIALDANEAKIRKQLASGEYKRHVVPKTPNLKGRVEGAVGHLREVALLAQKLADLFYPRAKSNIPFTSHLIDALKTQLPADDSLRPHVEWCLAQIERFFDHRNALIHGGPGKDQQFILRDYEMQSDGNLVAPTIEIVHPDSPLPRMDIGQFLKDARESVSLTFETFVAGFCDRNAPQRHKGFVFGVEKSNQDRRTGKRFFWNGMFIPGFPLNEPKQDSGPTSTG
ncbi:MAG: hypothetical protein JOY77_07270 [Alphaproteobacteria bacterium]|nr:hypothetical protein [Alphaproteobacteria bacterium]MBV9062714.1 hypothetical protein [Alphaproteobacteria bacterium]